MQKKKIIFEEICPGHKWIIKWYLFRNKDIFFLRLNRIAQGKKWFQKLIDKGRVKKINFKFKPNIFFDGFYYDLAFDNINIFFRILDESKIIAKLKALYSNNHIEFMFKKVLNKKLARFYYLNYILNRSQNEHPNEKITFVPSNGIEIYRGDGCEIYDYFKFYNLATRMGIKRLDTSSIKFALWATADSCINGCRRKIGTLFKIFGFLFLVSINKIISIFGKRRVKDNYRYAIMIVSPRRQFLNSIQKVDFLIDNETIKKEDVIFLSCKKLKKKNRHYMKNNGLSYLDNVDKFISKEEIKKILPVYFYLLASFLREDNLVLDTGLRAIYFYIRWRSIIKNIKIQNLITLSDFGQQSIARNIILEQEGCLTYYYLDSINFSYFFAKESRDVTCKHSSFGFLYYDYFIAWNKMISEYFKNSQNKIRNYMDLGCFWSEHLRLIQEGGIKSDFKNKLYLRGYKEDMKLVSVFDSTFPDCSLTTCADGIKFLEEILQLLEDSPNIYVVLKEKKSRDYHRKMSGRFRDILVIYGELENHKRCYCLKNWENPSEVIAFSDLTISFPFTSTTFEALSARKKAFWYDAADKFRDTYYDSIPGLVCHNYEELLERTKQLLNIDDSEYNNYLETHIKGKIENYLDGNAITRFRKVLTGERS